jgi:Endonuclease/Exonuclease/phosphatase family
MLLKYLLLLVLVMSSTFLMSQQKAAPQYISAVVGFYNLENLFDTINDPSINDEEFLPLSEKKYNSNAYYRKLNNMAKAIKGVGIDNNPEGLALLGVVEVENATVLKDLCATDSLKDRNYQYVHFDSPDERGIDVGLLYNPKYFTVLKAIPHHVTLPDKHPTRDILVVKGDFVGETVFVLVNHWPSRRGASSNSFDANNKSNAYNNSGGDKTNQVSVNNVSTDGEEQSRPAREAAAKACMFVIDSIQKENPNAKIMVMGDLNDDPNSPSVKDVMAVKYEIADVQPKQIYNALGKFFINGKGTLGSLAYNGKWNLMDQLMFTHPFLDTKQLDGWFFYSAHIFYRDFLINQKGDYKGYPHRSWAGNKWINGYSDHLPVYSILVRALPE